jgi:hypothetical protein
VTKQGLALGQQLREHVAREVDRLALGDVIEDARFEYVNARVDSVTEDLAPRRLFEEPLNRAVVVGDDDAELKWVLHRLERDRGHRALVLVHVDKRGEVDVGEDIARDDEEGLIEFVLGVAH